MVPLDLGPAPRLFFGEELSLIGCSLSSTSGARKSLLIVTGTTGVNQDHPGPKLSHLRIWPRLLHPLLLAPSPSTLLQPRGRLRGSPCEVFSWQGPLPRTLFPWTPTARPGSPVFLMDSARMSPLVRSLPCPGYHAVPYLHVCSSVSLRGCGPANSNLCCTLPPAHRRGLLCAPFSLLLTHWVIISYLTFVSTIRQPFWAGALLVCCQLYPQCLGIAVWRDCRGKTGAPAQSATCPQSAVDPLGWAHKLTQRTLTQGPLPEPAQGPLQTPSLPQKKDTLLHFAQKCISVTSQSTDIYPGPRW